MCRSPPAAAAFEAAFAEAQRCELPFVEMLARRDFIVHVLSGEQDSEQRKSELAKIGNCISKMVMPAREYKAVLDPLDPLVAKEAFNAQK